MAKRNTIKQILWYCHYFSGTVAWYYHDFFWKCPMVLQWSTLNTMVFEYVGNYLVFFLSNSTFTFSLLLCFSCLTLSTCFILLGDRGRTNRHMGELILRWSRSKLVFVMNTWEWTETLYHLLFPKTLLHEWLQNVHMGHRISRTSRPKLTFLTW